MNFISEIYYLTLPQNIFRTSALLSCSVNHSWFMRKNEIFMTKRLGTWVSFTSISTQYCLNCCLLS